MAGAGIRSLPGQKPMGNKALSAHVTERAWAKDAPAKAAMMAGLQNSLAKHLPAAGAGGEAAAKLAPAAASKGPTVARAKDFAESGNYEVTTSSGKKVKIFRDKDQFSSPHWHMVDDEHNSMGIGSTKAEAVARVERTNGAKAPDPFASRAQRAAPIVGKNGTIMAGPLSAEHPHGHPGTIMAPSAGPRPLTASQKITSGAKGSDSQKLTAGSLPAFPATGAHPATTGTAPAAKPATGPQKAPKAQPIDRHVGVTIRKGENGQGVPTEVRVLGRKGDLFMHTNGEGRFTVTHGPTRGPIAEVATKAQARAMMNGMSKGKTLERALAGDQRAIAAVKRYGARVVTMKPAVKPAKPPREVKPPREPKGPKGHAEKASGGTSGHGGKIPKADFSGIVAPFKAAAGIFPSMVQHGIGVAQTLSGLAAITAASHGRR